MNNYFPEEVNLNLTDDELLKFCDNPRNFEVNDCRDVSWVNENVDFPKNVLVTLTHWGYSLPEEAFESLASEKIRLLKNFSDFWTTEMVKKSWIPVENIIIFEWSRAIWDPNRQIRTQKEDDDLPEAKKFIRQTDFGKQVVLDNPDLYRYEGIVLVERYHENIKERLDAIEGAAPKSFLFDIHDTWVNLMNVNPLGDKIRPEWFPKMCVGNLDWGSCSMDVVSYFADRIENYLWFRPLVNEPYKWGYVTQKHWWEERKELNLKRNAIQVEIWRYLYLKESVQEIDYERTKIIWEGLKRAILDTVLRFDCEE